MCALVVPDHATLENLPVGVFSIEEPRSGIISYANPAFCRLLGYSSPAVAVGRSFDETFQAPGERLRDLVLTLSPETLSSPGVVNWQAERRRFDDGERIDVFISLAPTFGRDGKLARLDGVVEEVAACCPEAQTLRSCEDRFRTLFEHSSVGMVLTDERGRITRTNEAFCRLVDRPASVLTGALFSALVHPDDANDDVFSGFDARSERVFSFVPSELRFIREGGEVVWGCVSHTCLQRVTRSERGEVGSVSMLTIQEITIRKRLEEGVLRAEKLESLAVLAGGIAHDFNNVLTAIVGNIGLAAVSLVEGADASSQLMLAQRAAMQARDLTRQLATFARGGEPLRRVASLVDVIQDAALVVLGGSDSRTRIRKPSELPVVSFDPAQMTEVFRSLLTNAVQAIDVDGHIDITVSGVSLGVESGFPIGPGEFVLVSVRDDGKGIPRDIRERIFDPYFSTEGGGRGLGLATAYSVVHKHGGHIAVESEWGRGATFKVYLPAAEGCDIPGDSPAHEEPSSRGSARLLIMDDEPSVREVAREFLRRSGYDVDMCANGDAALAAYASAIAEGQPYDAVILDLIVPGGRGGGEIIGTLRETDPRVRAIVSSAYSSEPIMAHHRDYGFVGVIPKPYTYEEFVSAVDEVLSLSDEELGL